MRRALLVLPILLLVGCKSSLLENLDEAQANQIVAVLSQHGIEGFKERNGDKRWNVSVKNGDVVAATELTRDYALPRDSHANLGELFSRQGLISNPEEDRVRYVYGITQELSETLEKIDGVLVARVHVVQPERDPLMRQVSPPSASVMLRYRSDYNLDYMNDKIRNLVAGSVEGLTPERVFLTFVPITPDAMDSNGLSQSCANAQRGGGHSGATQTLIVVAVMALLLIVAAWIWRSGIRSFSPTLFRRREHKRAAARNEAKPSGDKRGDGAP
jgi:type III secretion protein J